MSTAVRAQCAIVIQDALDGEPAGCLFVSTSLATWTTANPEQFARDFQINDTVYRRLDPEYYIWLRSRMVLAKKAATSGHLAAPAFEDLRVRFNGVHEWAIKYFGEDELLAAVRILRAGDYKPPVAEGDAPHDTVPRGRKSVAGAISSETTAMVEAISERALSLGWKRERLHGTGGKGTLDPQRGLVCLLKPADRIGKITAQSIEIIHPPPQAARQRFYNPDVEQPWRKKIAGFMQKDEKQSRAPGISR